MVGFSHDDQHCCFHVHRGRLIYLILLLLLFVFQTHSRYQDPFFFNTIMIIITIHSLPRPRRGRAVAGLTEEQASSPSPTDARTRLSKVCLLPQPLLAHTSPCNRTQAERLVRVAPKTDLTDGFFVACFERVGVPQRGPPHEAAAQQHAKPNKKKRKRLSSKRRKRMKKHRGVLP